MKKNYIILVFIIMTFINCKDIKNNECISFNLSDSEKEITHIELMNKNEIIKDIVEVKSIDSVLSVLEKGCSKRLKFSSHKYLNFYSQDSIIFKIFINENLFKYKGVVYEINDNGGSVVN